MTRQYQTVDPNITSSAIKMQGNVSNAAELKQNLRSCKLIPTVEAFHKEGKYFVTVNEADFDEAIHLPAHIIRDEMEAQEAAEKAKVNSALDTLIAKEDELKRAEEEKAAAQMEAEKSLLKEKETKEALVKEQKEKEEAEKAAEQAILEKEVLAKEAEQAAKAVSASEKVSESKAKPKRKSKK